MKAQIKNEPVEFQLVDHPLRVVERAGGWPYGFDKKRIIRRGREFFLALDPNADADRAIFELWYRSGTLLTNGHSAAQLVGFDLGFAQPECEALLKSIHDTRVEIPKLENEHARMAAEAQIMKVAAEENCNPASVTMFFEQIETRERSAKLLKLTSSTLKRKLANDQQRVFDLLDQERARSFAAELEIVRAEAVTVNAMIMEAYQRANQLRPQLKRLTALSPPGKRFSSELGYAGTIHLDDITTANLKQFYAVPGLRLKPDALAFEIRKVEPVAQSGGKQ